LLGENEAEAEEGMEMKRVRYCDGGRREEKRSDVSSCGEKLRSAPPCPYLVALMISVGLS
jgi:hypothetical protein